MEVKDKIIEQFVKNGFVQLSPSKLPINLLWQPDIILSKNKFTYLILLKSNNSIPSSFLNRISNIPKGNFIPLILFAQKLKDKDEKEILSLGISLAYYFNGRLSGFKIKKKISQAVVKKEVRSKELNVIDIFVSSKQEGLDKTELKERGLIKRTINLLRETRDYPFSPPRLIEYDRFKLSELHKHIDRVMNGCNWIVILLEDSPSPDVAYEFMKAIEIIPHENIFLFVKETSTCKTLWKKVLTKVENLDGKTIKWLPYLNLDDLEVTLTRAINNRMNEIYNKKKIKIFEKL